MTLSRPRFYPLLAATLAAFACPNAAGRSHHPPDAGAHTIILSDESTLNGVVRSSLKGMENRLGLRLRSSDVRIETYPDDAAYRKAGGLGNTDACFLPPDRILLKGAHIPPAALSHEIGHVLIGDATRGRCPDWLEEGIINHENHVLSTGQYSADEIAELGHTMREIEREEKDWTLESVCDESERPGAMGDEFYAVSWSATDYLYRTYGRPAVMTALHRMEREDPDDAFQDAFDRSPDDIEKDWKATLTLSP